MKWLPLVALLAFTGCKSGKTELEPGGPYGTNTYAYRADLIFATAVKTIQDGMKWEYENRQVLWDFNPGIKKAFDSLRVELPNAELAYRMARKNFLTDPIEPNASSVEHALVEIRRLLKIAMDVLNSYDKP